MHKFGIVGTFFGIRRLRDIVLPRRLDGGDVALHYFNVYNGREFLDHIGSDLPDLDAVRTEAVKTAAELLRGECKDLWSGSDWKMIVTNEGGHQVLTLRFSANDMGGETHPPRG